MELVKRHTWQLADSCGLILLPAIILHHPYSSVVTLLYEVCCRNFTALYLRYMAPHQYGRRYVVPKVTGKGSWVSRSELTKAWGKCASSKVETIDMQSARFVVGCPSPLITPHQVQVRSSQM